MVADTLARAGSEQRASECSHLVRLHLFPQSFQEIDDQVEMGQQGFRWSRPAGFPAQPPYSCAFGGSNEVMGMSALRKPSLSLISWGGMNGFPRVQYTVMVLRMWSLDQQHQRHLGTC